MKHILSFRGMRRLSAVVLSTVFLLISVPNISTQAEVINPILSNANICFEVYPPVFTYTGEEIKPEFDVVVGTYTRPPSSYIYTVISEDGEGTSAGVNAGEVTFKITTAVNDPFDGEREGHFTIAKASGMTAKAPEPITVVSSETDTFDLNDIVMDKEDCGTRTYTLGELTDENGILSEISLDGSVLTYTGNESAGGTAEQLVTITTQNYEDVTVTIQFTKEALPEKIKGDINADGVFSVADVVTLQKWLLCIPDAMLADWQSGDLCEDERIDVFDLCMMKRLLIENHQSIVKNQICIIGDDTLPDGVKSKLANTLSELNPKLDYSDLTFENTGWNYITDSSFNLCGKYYFFDVYYKEVHLDKERYDIIVMDYDDGTFAVEGHEFLQDLSLDKAAEMKLSPVITEDDAIEKAKEYCTDLAVPEELTADCGEVVITSMINPTAEFVIYSLEEGISAYKVKAENTELIFTDPDKASSTLSMGVTVYVDPETGSIIDCNFTKGWIMY
ncbi:MAG: dockerin type I repeat-containing protein [Ruminococcus sp.]|nr:dockerin type I repeat-containing protein [Ruminococcus sp.]